MRDIGLCFFCSLVGDIQGICSLDYKNDPRGPTPTKSGTLPQDPHASVRWIRDGSGLAPRLGIVLGEGFG